MEDYSSPRSPSRLPRQLISNPQFPINKSNYPRRPDQKKHQVGKEGWFPAFMFMADKLSDPGHGKYERKYSPGRKKILVIYHSDDPGAGHGENGNAQEQGKRMPGIKNECHQGKQMRWRNSFE